MMPKHHVRFVLKWTLCLGLLAFAFSKADLANLRAHLRQVDGRWLAAGLGLCALNNASGAKQFQAGLRPLGMALSFWRMSAIMLISAFYSMVVPAGMVAGGLASFYKIGKAGGRYLEAGALVVALRLLNTLLLVAFGLAGAFCERSWLEGAGRWIPIAFAAGLCLALWPFADPRIAQNLLLRLRVNPLGFGARLHDGLRAFECLVAGDRLRILAWGLAVNATNLLAWVCLAHASAIHLPALTLLWIAAFQGLVQMLPFTIGGLGVRELTLVALLEPYGVPAPPALVFASLILLVMLANTVLGGLLELFDRPQRRPA